MPAPGSDGHRSSYDWEFLATYKFYNKRPSQDVPKVLWGKEIKTNPPTAEYADVMNSESGVAAMTMQIVCQPPGPRPPILPVCDRRLTEQNPRP